VSELRKFCKKNFWILLSTKCYCICFNVLSFGYRSLCKRELSD